jgi:transglutaminase-like putative cysteine protease
MKRPSKILTAAILILLCLALTSCGFVSFVRYEDDLESIKNDYIEKIRALYDENDYFEEQKREYIQTLLEFENRIRESKSAQEILNVFEEYFRILGDIPLDIELTRVLVYKQMQELAAENLYRADEQVSVDWLLGYFKTMIDECDDISECENLLPKFKTSLSNVKTDAQLTAEELAAHKNKLSIEFGTSLNYALYRSEERDALEKIVKDFRVVIKDAKTIAECDAMLAEYNANMALVPTADIRLESDRLEWVDSWREELVAFGEKYSLDISAKTEEILSLIAEQSTEFDANAIGGMFMVREASMLGKEAFDVLKKSANLYISNFVDADAYRQAERDELDSVIKETRKNISGANSAQEVLKHISNAENSLSNLRTNDEYWMSEDEQFVLYMSQKYGEKALVPPSSLTLAKSTAELARIIDYYAFYQLDAENFERGTFRVRLDFAHMYSDYVIKDVYWYCELIRSAVGISGYFEKDTSELVVTLTPYDLASVSNTDKPIEIERYDSLIEYNSNSVLTERSDDFDDFPYYELYKGKYVTVWNSQQLWYALEKECIPMPVENSPAELVLEKAKEILREIIKDGMSIEEKVFAIYSWYADNVTYDYGYDDFLYVEDRENFPDSMAATLHSFHAEGALLENLAVCCSFAKSCLVLMRIEGIEAYRVILHDYENNAVDNLGRKNYGSHAIITLRASDGKFYYCDVEQCGAGHNLTYQKYHQLLVTAKEQCPYNSTVDRIWTELDYAESLPMKMFWDNLTYNGKSLFVKREKDLLEMLEAFCAEGDSTKQINIFNDGSAKFDIREVLDANPNITYHPFSYGGLDEYMINYTGK